MDITEFLEAEDKELPKGVAATFPISITIKNLADTDIAAVTGNDSVLLQRHSKHL